MVNTLPDLKKVKKVNKIMLGHMGKRKKIEIAKKAKEKKITILNFNSEKELKPVKETK